MMGRSSGNTSESRTYRFSLVRMAGVLTSCILVGFGALFVANRASESFVAQNPVPYSPYVDITLTPISHFEDPLQNPSLQSNLGFIVADTGDPCLPSWGTYYSLDAASRALDLDRRIIRYRERGGEVAISFGGQANSDLAVACTDVDSLVAAYRSVVDRYDPKVLDFDIEGEALLNSDANARRAKAVAIVQGDTDIEVWLTIPVAGHGLIETGTNAIDVFLAAGVDINIVNLMTMNYGQSRDLDSPMGDASIHALEAAHVQLGEAYRRSGLTRESSELWARLGATVMIGQNDVGADRFDISDAHELVAFGGEVGLGQISMWSLNRDFPCEQPEGSNILSNTCSGVTQRDGEFGAVLSSAVPTDAAEGEPVLTTVIRDDPNRSPYPIWRETRQYEQGTKIVWQSRVYEAKWWSGGAVPGVAVDNPWDTPWRYLGPVVEADLIDADATDTVEGTWEIWRSETIYLAGDEIEYDDHVFRAAWWTQGDAPDPDPAQTFDHPWEYLGDLMRRDRVEEAEEQDRNGSSDRVFVGLDEK